MNKVKQKVRRTQSVPATLYPDVYPKTSTISVFHIRAVSFRVHSGGGGAEKVNPGSEGITTSNETLLPDFRVFDRVRMSATGRNSRKESSVYGNSGNCFVSRFVFIECDEPGQPWLRMMGMTSVPGGAVDLA